jgi:hypothetical protein
MSGTEEIDDGFTAALIDDRFKNFGSSTTKAHARAERERLAGQSPAQRSRRGPPTKQVNFRATERTRDQIERLATKLGSANTEIIAEAIELLARKHGCEGDGP